jgi:hypothetical protein
MRVKPWPVGGAELGVKGLGAARLDVLRKKAVHEIVDFQPVYTVEKAGRVEEKARACLPDCEKGCLGRVMCYLCVAGGFEGESDGYKGEVEAGFYGRRGVNRRKRSGLIIKIGWGGGER